VQRARQYDDAWTDTVLDWCTTRPGLDEVTVAAIAKDALKFRETDISRAEQNRIGSILRLAGWTNHNVRRHGRQTKVWLPPSET
jgi:hypothetical protein